MERVYACIDLKSFYASVECHERNLNPITTNLVVADSERTEKTICLAVSPSLKSYGLKGRARLYEVVQKVKEVNLQRKNNLPSHKFSGKSFNNEKIRLNPNLELDYIVAKPRMSLYIKYSTMIYNVYLKYLSSEDIFVYSIDEVFCDLTNYLKYSKMSSEELVTKMILDVIKTTGITATAGIGTNLYLAKVAMDIVAKKARPNENNVRIAYLDEESYRQKLWDHVPITDFWRVGDGIKDKLMENKMFTMGDICLKSLENEEILYELFGVNAEIIIDHAWGYEPCTIKDIKNYKPQHNSLSRGQVLHEPYDYLKTRVIVIEIMDLLSLDLVANNMVTNSLTLTIGYGAENIKRGYDGAITKDYYGRSIPKHAHGSISLTNYTSSSKILTENILTLYKKIADTHLFIRRISITVSNLIKNEDKAKIKKYEQFDLFSNADEKIKSNEKESLDEEMELKMQKTILKIKEKYGKNAMLKGVNLLPEATTRSRNNEIGGHHA